MNKLLLSQGPKGQNEKSNLVQNQTKSFETLWFSSFCKNENDLINNDTRGVTCFANYQSMKKTSVTQVQVTPSSEMSDLVKNRTNLRFCVCPCYLLQ